MAQPPPCPYCGAFSYQMRDKRWLVCRECEQEFDVQHDVCRACGRLNKATATTCAYCSSRLRSDTVDQLIAARGKTHQQWHEERTAVAVRQKPDEEQASQRRMEAYWAEEQARREAAAQAALKQQRRERRILWIVGLVVALFVLVMLVVVLVTR